jgi:hypothetical protein
MITDSAVHEVLSFGIDESWRTQLIELRGTPKRMRLIHDTCAVDLRWTRQAGRKSAGFKNIARHIKELLDKSELPNLSE